MQIFHICSELPLKMQFVVRSILMSVIKYLCSARTHTRQFHVPKKTVSVIVKVEFSVCFVAGCLTWRFRPTFFSFALCMALHEWFKRKCVAEIFIWQAATKNNNNNKNRKETLTSTISMNILRTEGKQTGHQLHSCDRTDCYVSI